MGKASSRKDFIKKLGLGVAGSGLAMLPLQAKALPQSDETFSIIHLADMHVTPKRKGNIGYAACIDSINALEKKPELVLMGGDMAFDGLYTELERFDEYINLFLKETKRLTMPWYPCIGNHDQLGLTNRRKVPADHPKLGVTYIMEKIGMKEPYYSFNKNGWHFAVLNSNYRIDTEDGPGYEARIGEEQLNWLRFDLGKHTKMPKIVVSHHACFNHKYQISADFEAKAMNQLIIQDNKELRLILERHRVKAFLQGHTHTAEDFLLNEVRYINTQAASAAWWGGNWLGNKPGYTILELSAEDIVSWKRHEFAWTHQLEPEDTLEKQRNVEAERQEKHQQELLKQETG